MSTRGTDHRRRAASLGFALVAAVAAWSAAEWTRHGYAVERAIEVARSTGYGALVALVSALLVTPTSRMLERLSGPRLASAALAAYRRALGLSAACLSLGHAALTLTTYLDGELFALVRPYLRAGAVATVVLVALAITSFPAFVRLSRVRLWKELHRFVYVAALFVLQHVLLSPFGPKRETLVVTALLVALWATRFLPSRTRDAAVTRREERRESAEESPAAEL